MENVKVSKIIDHPDLVRDMNSKAVLASDLQKYQEHKQKKHYLKNILNQGEEIENLKKDISEIKEMLLQLTKINK
jgi:protein subunit release factor A